MNQETLSLEPERPSGSGFNPQEQAPEKTFFEGATRFESQSNSERIFNAKVFEKIGEASREIGNSPSWDETLAVFDLKRNQLLQETIHTAEQEQQIEALFSIGAIFDRQRHRAQDSKTRGEDSYFDTHAQNYNEKRLTADAIEREKESAYWQQQMAHLILTNRENPNLEEYLDDFWGTLEKFDNIFPESAPDLELDRRGISRLVTSVLVMQRQGFICETSTGQHDAIDKIDFVAMKKTDNENLALLVQVKPNSREDNDLVTLDTFYPLPERGAEIPKDIWGAVEWARKNQPETKQRLMPVLLRMPNYAKRPLDISTTGIANKKFIDTLSELCLTKLKALEEAPQKQKRHKRRVYEPGK